MPKIEHIIDDLIQGGYEGVYWDFKREWYSNNASLVHDILCMANAYHNGDRYIIIGVDDICNVVGVEGDINRKTLQQVIDTLRSKKFSQDNRPEVGLKTLIVEDKELDIIIIKSKSLKPYYLIEDYPDKGKTVRANYIYTREGDCNTEINKQAPQHLIEQMWRERFGIDLPPFKRLHNLITHHYDWHRKENYHYHNYYPEFRIELAPDERLDLMSEPFYYFYPNATGADGTVAFYYHTTIIYNMHIIYCDEFRLTLPYPDMHHFHKSQSWIYYYTKNSFKGIFLDYITAPPKDTTYKSKTPFSCRGGEPPFLIFEDENELNEFARFIENPQNEEILEGISYEEPCHHRNILDKDSYLKEKIVDMCKYEAYYDYWQKQQKHK